jgi:hypothetical protein
MVYDESGRFPLSLTIHSRMVSYWVKMLHGQENKIVSTVYRYLFSRYNNENVNIWITFIQHIFDSCGFRQIKRLQCLMSNGSLL